jgi:O-antigen ligase
MRIYTILLSVILLVSGATDVIRKVNVGSLTMQGAWTIIIALSCFGLVFVRHRLPKSAFWGVGLVLFVISGALSSYINMPTSPISFKDQSQNLLVYAVFAGTILLSTGESYREPVQPPWYVTHGFLRATQLSMALFGLSMLMARPTNPDTLMGPRSFAIYAIVGMAWLLASWRYKAARYMLLHALGLLALVAFSFSRTATIICLVLFPISQLSPRDGRSWFRVGLWVGLIGLMAYLTFTYVEPIRNRFTAQGDNAKIGELQVNTSGRDRMWEAARISAADAPILGKGPGSVGFAIAAVNRSAAGHPHNDYLRLQHDYGWLGLGLWLSSYLILLAQAFRNWAWAERRDPVSVHIHQATVMAMLAVLAMMTTDNIVVYQFAMAPLGIMIGASLGLGQARRKLLQEVKVMDWVNSLPSEPDADDAYQGQPQLLD